MSFINAKVPTIPSQYMHEYIWVLTGRNKIGKTKLGSDFPKPYFFKLEPGTSGLLSYETDIIKESNKSGKHVWQVFKEATNEFIKIGGAGFQTAVIDPYGVAYDYCMDYVCKNLGIDHPSDLEWGKGWQAVNNEFEGLTRKLVSNDFTVLFIAHMKTNNKKDGLGGEKDIVDLDIGGSAGKFIKNLTDVFLLADYDENGERKLFLRPTTNQEAGSRLDFGVDKIPLEFDMLKERFDEAIERVNEEYNITEEMIKKYYNHKEKEEEELKLGNWKRKIIKYLKENEIPPEKNREILSEKTGLESINNVNDIETLKEYLKFLKSKV